LTHDYQVDYMRAAIDSFNQNGDGALAQSRYNALGEDGNAVYKEIIADPAGQNTEVIIAFGTIVGNSPAAEMPPPDVTVQAEVTPIPEGAEGGGLGAWLPWLCVLGVLLLAGAAGSRGCGCTSYG
jgi:hypothetical protein